MLNNLNKNTKINLKNLEETVMNKVFRRTFEKWVVIENVMAERKKFKYKKFFEFLFEKHVEVNCSNENKKMFLKNLISKLTKFTQMDKKIRAKNISSMLDRRPKFLNLVLRKKQLDLCYYILKTNYLFEISYKEIKSEIFSEYEYTKKFIFNEISLTDFNSKNKNFSFNVHNNLKNCLKKIEIYLEKINYEINPNKIKNHFKNVKSPIFLSDFQELFKSK